MNKIRLMYLFLFLGATLFAIKFFEQAYRDYSIKQSGTQGIATIESRPDCGRSNSTVDVRYMNKIYLLRIGKNDCIKGEYSIGDKVPVIYSDVYDYMITPGRQVAFLFYMSIVLWVLPLYCLYKLIKPLN